MPEYVIGLRIVSSSEDRALEMALQQLGKLEKKQLEVINSAGKVGSAWTGAGSAIKSALLNVVGPIASIGGLVALLFKGAAAAIEKRNAVRGLTTAVNELGQDGAATARAAAALGDSVQRLGIESREVIEATRDLTYITKDGAEALSAAALATDMAAKRGVEYSTSLQTIRDLMVGSDRGVIAAHKLFGIEATSAQEALDKLNEKFRGAGKDIHDATTEIASAKAIVSDFFESVGDKAVEATGKLIGFAKMLQLTGHALLTGKDDWQQYWRAFREQGDEVQGWFTQFLKTVQQGVGVAEPGAFPSSADYFRDAKTAPPLKVHGTDQDELDRQAKAAEDAAAKARAEFGAAMEESEDRLAQWTAAWNGALSELAATRGIFAKETMANVAQQLAHERQVHDMALARDLKAVEGNAAAEALVKETYSLRWQARVRQAAEERERLETEQAIKISEAQQLVVGQMERELELKLQLVDLSAKERKAVTEMLARLREETEERAYNVLLLRQEQELKSAKPEERAGVEARQAKEREAAAKRVTNARVAGEQAARAEGDKTVKWEAATDEEKKQRAIDTAQTLIGMAGQAFGNSKGVAIAQAIMNTYLAATKAIAELGPIAGPVAAAAMIAFGMAQVAKIASAEPGGAKGGGSRVGGADPSRGRGFDDPRNDAMLERGGARWADDAWAKIASGWARQFPLAQERAASSISNQGPTTVDNRNMSSTSQIDNSRGPEATVHVRALSRREGLDMAKEISRLLSRGDRMRRRSLVTRGPDRLGGGA